MITKKKFRIGTLILAMLLIGVVFVASASANDPLESASESEVFGMSSSEDRIIPDFDPQIPPLEFNGSCEKKIINSEFSINKGDDSHNLPIGSIIRYASDGTTTVYTSDGKECFFTIDAETAMIPTPSGLKLATHVLEIPSESEIRTNENITHVYHNGTLILTVLNENYQKTDAITEYSGWIEASVDRNINSLSYFDAYWKVPTSPPSPSTSAINFLFTAIEPYGESGIIQPVLEWNQAGSHRWTGAAWSGKNGIFYHSPRIAVSADDIIKGLMTWDNTNKRWTVSFKDVNKNSQVSIYSTDVGNTHLDVFTTLEANHVENNNDMPGDTTFYNMVFKDSNSNPFSVIWEKKYYSGVPSGITDLKVEIFSSSKVTLHTAN